MSKDTIEANANRARDLLALVLSWHFNMPYGAARAEVEAVMPGPWWFKMQATLVEDAPKYGGAFVHEGDFPEDKPDPTLS